MDIIKTSHVSKFFGSVSASNDISINVNEGEIYGFLGLNGAGKTTLIRILLGMISPDQGEVELFGEKVGPEFKQWNKVGYLVEGPASYPNLTVEENLKIFYHLRNLQKPALLDDIINNLKLEKYRHVKEGTLSMGNKQRLGLAKALMHQPKLLLLDEPINGLDPEGIVEVRELLKDLAQKGSTIFVSSHILGEISRIANRIAIINNGKIIKEVSSAQLFDQLERKLVVETANNSAARKELEKAGFSQVQERNKTLELFDSFAIDKPEKVSELLVNVGLAPKEVHTVIEDLEMFFLRNIKNT